MPDPSVTPEADEQLRQAFEELQANYNSDEEPDNEPEPEDDETADPEPTPETTEDDDPEIEVSSDLTLRKSELAELARLRQFLDGETVDSIKQSATALQDQRAAATALPDNPPYTPPAPPEGLDLDDPTLKALWDRQVATEQLLHNQQQEIQRRRSIDIADGVERGVSDWNGKYKLDDSTLSEVRQAAARTGVALALESQGKTPYECTTAALEAAFWSNPTLRNQYLTAAEEDAKRTATKDKSKQQKLSALSGRGSSASSRKPPTEMTAEERRQGVIAELTEAINRN